MKLIEEDLLYHFCYREPWRRSNTNLCSTPLVDASDPEFHRHQRLYVDLNDDLIAVFNLPSCFLWINDGGFNDSVLRSRLNALLQLAPYPCSIGCTGKTPFINTPRSRVAMLPTFWYGLPLHQALITPINYRLIINPPKDHDLTPADIATVSPDDPSYDDHLHYEFVDIEAGLSDDYRLPQLQR
jgi:hypothetical protein